MAPDSASRGRQRVAALLRAGVPLTLLIDLVVGPRSADLYAHERPRRAR